MSTLIYSLKVDISDITESLELEQAEFAIDSLKSSDLQQRINGILELNKIIEKAVNIN